MPELFDEILKVVSPLNKKQALMVKELHELAIENDVVCQQAPNIWDGDTMKDANLAQKYCHGMNEDGYRFADPCPIMNECLETAIETNSKYGVWGGTTPRERWRLLKK